MTDLAGSKAAIAVQPASVAGGASGYAVQSAISLISTVLIGVALVPAIIQAFLDKPLYYPEAAFTLGNFARLFTDPEIVRTFGTTGLFCLIVVSFSMVVGTTLAVLVGRTDLPGRGVLLGVLLWPLFISPQIIGFGAILAYGPYGLITASVGDAIGVARPWNLYSVVGIAIISGIAAAPVTMLYCIGAARQQDPNHDAAARVVGAGPGRILRRINLPLMRPALVFALIMNIVSALEALAIPLILGNPVGIRLLTTMIYDLSFDRGTPNYGLVAVLALMLMALVAVLFLFQRLVLAGSHRFVSLGARSGQLRTLPLGRWRWPIFAAVVAYIAIAIVALLGCVALRAVTQVFSPDISPFEVLTLANFETILSIDVYVRSITNTLILSVVGAAAGTALIAGVALVAQRSDYPLRRAVDAIAQLPRVIPGFIVGLGVFYASVFIPGASVLRNTIWLLFIAYLIRFLSSGYGIVSPALLQISPDFDRAAKSVGAGWTTTMRRIVLPLSKPALLSCFILLMILIIKEYASAVFLMAPGSEVMGATMLALWLQGQTGPVAALAVLQVALTAVMTLAAKRLLGVKLHG